MAKMLSLLYCTLFALALQAQIAPPIDLFEPVGDNLYNIALDVDSDGDLEVVCATSERLFWLEYQEDGHFSSQHLIAATGWYYRVLVAADIDEDGDDDLVYTSNETGLGVHFNLGDGEWSDVMELYNPGAVIDCYVADLDGDDHLDIVTSTASDVRWLAGNGDGSFGPAQLISDEHVTTTSVHAEDLDEDGDLDLLVAASGSDRLSWHENLGNGTFSDFQVINDVYQSQRMVTTADLDGDERPDIVCANWGEEQEIGAGAVWYRNLGAGSFELQDTLFSRGWTNYVHAEDMDADGDMDIVVTHGLDEMDWRANDGAGNFGPSQELVRLAAYLRFVETPDINGDGLPDVLYGINSNSPQKENILWRESIAPGQWAEQELVTMGGRFLSAPQVADMDQDGLLDIVVGSENTDALVWFKNEGFRFSQPRLIARKHNYDPSTIAVHDFNNDGWPDVFASCVENGTASPSVFCIFLNNGDGSFTTTPPFETWFYPQRDLQLVDMDSDGDLDMLWASPGFNNMENSNLGWVRNDGDSWSEPILLLSDVLQILDVVATDFDEDGQIDLMICKKDIPRLGWMEHTGNGNFSALEPINSNFTGAAYAQMEDINGDGLLDLVASDNSTTGGAHRIAWFENLGNGFYWGAQQDIFVGGDPIEKFAFADFDLDGRKDIITSTWTSGSMQWLQGLPDAAFAAPESFPGMPDRTRGFVVADMDNDGDLDLVGNGEEEAFSGPNRLLVAYNLANDESISGIVFNDINVNGEQDADEVGVGRVPINVEPEAIAVFADEEGRFTVYGRAGTYTLSPDLDECWSLTTTPTSYEVTFDGTDSVDSLRFGVAPNTETPAAAVTLASAPTRCGFTVPFWLNYRNDGCWTFDGEAYVVLDDLVTFVSAVPEPASQSGDTLFWSFSQLPPGASRSVELTMTIAGVDFIGSSIHLPAGVIPYDGTGQSLEAETFDFFSTINCAYDPNDKQVYPNRAEQPPFMENYTLFDETLLYTLRFQNTGTDTAFNIVLRDQLSTDLDWTTFRPGSSSHPFEATLHDDGLLEFHFRDILLVDSFTNEPGSHGFVQFEIEAQTGLDDGIVIENVAGIYFDFNPPIVTNTVNSILVETLPNFTPAAAFDYSTDELEADFTDASTNTPDTWLWDFGDGSTSMDQDPVYTYAEAGTYTVCLTASNAWGSTQYCEEVMIGVTSTEDFSNGVDIRLNPNPAKGMVWVECPTWSQPQRLVLYSAAGKPLQSFTLNDRITAWDLSELPAGSYWVRTEDGVVLPLVVLK